MTMVGKWLLPLLPSVMCLLLRTAHGSMYSGSFTLFSNLTDNYCSGDALLFSRTGVSLFYCIYSCFWSLQQSCVGVFYQELQQQCFACSQMDSANLLPKTQTVAWKRPNCSKYLVQSVGDSQFSVSSKYHHQDPVYARLGTIEGERGTGGWSSGRGDPDPYIQVDFLVLMRLAGVVIQSRSPAGRHIQWVTEYRVLASRDCSSWEYAVERGGEVKYFPGNTEVETKVTNLFDLPLVARCIRVNPTDYYTYPSLRFDVLGCDL